MLNWSTYGALPQLRSYAAALKHFETVKPIRGDANGTKPVGRRDQKWLAIYIREDKAVCIGSAWHKDKGKALLAYYPDGRVVIEQQLSASCRERIQRIAGLNIQRKNYEDWVTAAAHVDGKEVVGHYPLQLRYNGDRKATFILRDMASHIYLNPVPVYKHTINRKAKSELTKQYKPFMDYMEAMAKLSADPTQHSPWSKESMDNPRLPTVGNDDRRELFASMPNRWTAEGPLALLKLVESGETENWYKAMMWLGNGHWRKLLNEAKTDMMHMVHQQHRDALFTKVRVEAGKMVYDRYAQYFK